MLSENGFGWDTSLLSVDPFPHKGQVTTQKACFEKGVKISHFENKFVNILSAFNTRI